MSAIWDKSRRVSAGVVVFASALIAARAAAQVTPEAQDRAYTLSLMCAGVAAHFHDDSPTAMDAVKKMACVKGYDNKRVASDMIEMAKALANDARAGPNVMDGNRAVCRRLKLVR